MIISTNALSLFLLEHDYNRVSDCNLRLIHENICLDNPAVSNFKRVCTDFPYLALLTKSAKSGEAQVTYVHVSIIKNPLRGTLTSFALAGSLEALTVVTINAEHAFAGTGNKIRLPTTKSLLCTNTGNLSKSMKLCDWEALKAVFLSPLLDKVVVP